MTIGNIQHETKNLNMYLCSPNCTSLKSNPNWGSMLVDQYSLLKSDPNWGSILIDQFSLLS